MNQNQSIEKTVMPGINNMIMVVSGKGGVGKSTVAAGIAMSLAEEGYAVGLLDADIFGPSVPTLMNLHHVERPVMVEKDGKQVMEPFERFGIKVMSIGFFFDPEQAVIWRGPMVSNVFKTTHNRNELGRTGLFDYRHSSRNRRYPYHTPSVILHYGCIGGYHTAIGGNCRCAESNWHVARYGYWCSCVGNCRKYGMVYSIQTS